MSMDDPSQYFKIFSTLRSDTSRARWTAATKHRAPHKPLLLLSVIDLFAEGLITANLIELTPDLCETFTLYWSRVMPPDQRGNIALPFFYLRSDKFWHLVASPDKEEILAATSSVKSISQLRELVLGARLDDELYSLLCHEEARNVLRSVLIDEYFAPEPQKALLEQGVINVEAFDYSRQLLEQAKTKLEPTEPEVKRAVRDQGFRRAIVTAYSHRCAMCALRVITADGHTVVDAAHIVP
jgi:putative restriction endonuclease